MSSSNAFSIPWLSLCAIALCLGASLWGQSRAEEARRVIDASFADAEAYHLANPGTSPGALLAEVLGTDSTSRADTEHRAAADAERQAVLDDLMAPAERALAELPERRFALRVDAVNLLALLSYPFLHPGDAQLLVAVILLLALGLHIEPAMGRAGYGLALLGGGIFAGVGYLLTAPSDAAPLTGVTGCLVGAVTAYALRCGQACFSGTTPLGLTVAWGATLGPALHDRTWLLGTALGPPHPLPLESTLFTLAGGLLGGVVGMWLAGCLGSSSRKPAAASSQKSRHLRRALEAGASGRGREAFDLLSSVVAQNPGDADALVALWDVAGELGRRHEIHGAMLQMIRDLVRDGALEPAARHWLELAEEGVPEAAECALLVKLAPVLRHLERAEFAADALRTALDRPGGAEPVMATKIARLAEQLDPATAERAAWRALASPEIALEDREDLERILEVVMEPVSEWVRRRKAEREGGASWNTAMKVPIDIELGERSAEVLTAIPIALDEEELGLELVGRKRGLAYSRVQALSVAVVQDLGPRPVVVIDLVLNWNATRDEALHLVRLRSDRFDPRVLVPEIQSRADALRAFLAQLKERTGATPLPDVAAVLGHPFASFPALSDYHRTVLMVDRVSQDQRA